MKKLESVPIAIVGMAGIFPEAKNLREYWKNILDGRDCIKPIPESRWNIDDYYAANPGRDEKTYSKWGGFIPDIEFDPVEYGLPPNLLEITDVHQLLMLQLAKQALNDGGYSDFAKSEREKTGVILGIGGGQKLVTPLISRLQYPIWEKVLIRSGISMDEAQVIIKKIKEAYIPWEEGSFPGLLGNIVAGRIVNKLDLGGTSCVIDAACASSLAALRMAVSELVEGRCDTVISGGADTDSTIFMYISFTKTPALSRNARCTVFDQRADGMLIGEGAGTVILRRLEDAKRDGNKIYAVIKGVGASSDGKGKSIYAPSIAGQKVAIGRAYQEAGFTPASVGLIEAHGTGTIVGDQTEASALQEYFLENKVAPKSVAVGSIKSQIGHTKSAAGVASLIKTALALYSKVLPPTINVVNPLSQFTHKESPIYVNTKLRPWIKARDALPRRAGISAFGFGGTNYHVAVEENEYDHDAPYQNQDDCAILMFNHSTQEELVADLQKALENLHADGSEFFFQELVKSSNRYDLPVGKLSLGLVVSYCDVKEKLKTALKHIADRRTISRKWQAPGMLCLDRSDGLSLKGKNVVSCFSSKAELSIDCLIDLATKYPELRRSLGLMEQHLIACQEKSVAALLYPAVDFSPDAGARCNNDVLADPRFVAPAIGASNMGLFNLASKFGVKPAFLASDNVLGDLASIWAGKMISDDEYCQLVIAKGRQEAGKMTDKDFLSIIRNCKVKSSAIPVYSSLGAVVTPSDLENIMKQPLGRNRVISYDSIKELFTKGGNVFVEYNLSSCKFLPVIEESLGDNPQYCAVSLQDDPAVAQRNGDFVFKENLVKLRIMADLNVGVNPYISFENIARKMARGLATVTLNGSNYVSPKRKQAYQDLLNDGFSISRGGNPDAAVTITNDQINNNEENTMKLNAQPHPNNELVDHEPMSPKAEMIVKQIDRIQQNVSDMMKTYLSNQQETIKSLTDLVDERNKLSERCNTHENRNEEFAIVVDHAKSPSTVEARNEVIQPRSEKVESMAERSLASQQQDTFGKKSADAESLSTDMLKIVSEKTGYPEDILELKMDMESDLGIDSIKRVEILSAMQEAHPDLPQVDQSVLAELKTLQEVVDYMVELLNHTSSRADNLQNPSIAEVRAEGVTNTLATDMLKIVSEKTGYPEDILELKMDMESDLGIDSIKRVEILSAMQEAHPDLPQVDQSVLAELKTLQEVVDYMDGLLKVKKKL